jgi:hypothetical protein
VSKLDANASAELARNITDGLRLAREVSDDLEEMRGFEGKVVVATLRNWGKQEGCPCPIYVERIQHTFYIGPDSHGSTAIVLEEMFDESLAALPNADLKF